MDETEYEAIRGVARAQHMTVAEWVRQVLRQARRREPSRRAADKLDAVRRACEHTFPTADVETMLTEIEQGYGAVLPE